MGGGGAGVGDTVSSLDGWLIAVVGAIVGGVLTISGDVVTRILFSRKRFDGLLNSLREEVIIISKEARARIAGGDAVGAPSINPPLPTQAWTVIVATGELRRMKESSLNEIETLYRCVESANHVAGQAMILLQIAELSSNEKVRSAYREEARRATVEPFRKVVDEVEQALHALDGRSYVPTDHRPIPAQ